ncbi:MAG: TrkH family potassium uptake protein [Eubacteriaceae bacterium]|jgi:trk system potassium uptake protein TrkH|nr:TrkH family potassium uptake protein [Eubacteriaceae bacterium]
MDFRFKTIFKTLGFLLIITGIAMLPSLFCAYYNDDNVTMHAFMLSSLLSIGLGLLMYKCIPTSSRTLRIRDGYMTVLICWIACALFGAIPYYFSGQTHTLCNAIFEAVAGYTTTGASVISDHVLSDALLLWKATTHWLGGMGIVVFIISILPSFGISGLRIAAAETPGPSVTRTSAKTADTAKMLYFSYIFLTVCEFFMLWRGSSMGAFEALINSLGSISTAGLLLHPSGVAYYNSLYVELVISIFTILSSVNFMMYIYIIQRNWAGIRHNVELRVYLCIIAASTLMVSAGLYFSGTFRSIGESLRYGFFQVTAFASTSGFTITNYNNWPGICHMVLFILLFMGSCAASTGGGIKIIRIVVVFKLIARGFYRRVHPRSVRAVKIGGNTMQGPIVSSITTFVVLYLAIYVLTAVVLSLQNLDMTSTLSAAAALLSTTGSAFGVIGDAGNFAMFSEPLKLFMSLVMIIGRLELTTVLLIFLPEFWNPNKAAIR